MPHCLHYVNMIANPVFVTHKDFSVNENQSSFTVNVAAELMHKASQFRIGRCKNGGECKLGVIVGSVVFPVNIHRRKFVFKINHKNSPFRRLWRHKSNVKEKQADRRSKRRRRMSILQAAKGGKMRRLSFTLILLNL